MEVAGAAFPITPLLATCTKIVKILHDVSKKFKRAPLMMTSIATECSLIHVALAQLRTFDWPSLSSHGDSRVEQMMRATEAVVLGCTLTLSVIEEYAQELQEYVEGSPLSPTEQMGIMARVRVLWKEDELRELLLQLRGYQTGLTNMLRAAHDSFADDDDALATSSNTFGALLQRSRSSRSRKPLSIRAAMQQSMTYTNLSRNNSNVPNPAPQSSNMDRQSTAQGSNSSAPKTPPTQHDNPHGVSSMTADLYDGATSATANRKPVSDKARRKRPAFLALHSEDLEHATESARYALSRKERDNLRKSSPTVGENFTFLEAASDMAERAMPEDSRHLVGLHHPTGRREFANGSRRVGMRTPDFAQFADEDYDLEEHLEDPPVPPDANYDTSPTAMTTTPVSPKLHPITEESAPQPKKQKSSSSVRSQIINLPETARLRKQASGELARQLKEQQEAMPSVPTVKGPAGHPPRASSSLEGLTKRRALETMNRSQHADPTHLALRPRRSPHRSASTDARPHPTIPLPAPPPNRNQRSYGYTQGSNSHHALSPTSSSFLMSSTASNTPAPADQDTWPLTVEVSQEPPPRHPGRDRQIRNQGEGPSFPALRAVSPDGTPKPSRSGTPLFSNAPYPNTPRTNRSRSNTGLTLTEGVDPDSSSLAPSQAPSQATSVAPSVLSAQWYQSPQERLGLGSRISRSDHLPWEQFAQNEALDDELNGEEQDDEQPRDLVKHSSSTRKGQLFSRFPTRTSSRIRNASLDPRPRSPRSPLLTEKFLTNVKGLPTDSTQQPPNLERSQSVRSTSDKRTLTSRDGIPQSRDGNGRLDVPGKKVPKSPKDSRFPSLGELVGEYKNLANKWYANGYNEEDDQTTRPSTGSGSLRSGTLNEMVFQQPNGVPNAPRTVQPRASKDSNSTSSKSTKSNSGKSEKEKKKDKKKKPSLFAEMVTEYKSLSKNWYTEEDDEDPGMRRSTMSAQVVEEDLYEILGVTSGATKVEIKKAYHKAALSSHPDKVPESEREHAEIRFKSVSRAYEILSDDNQRELYDTHGISAFDGSRPGGPGGGVDLDDLMEQMFGMHMGGEGFGFGGAGFPGAQRPGKRRMPRKGPDEDQPYEVTLEDLYKGKTTKFSSTKKVVCSHCKGTGGKEKAKKATCSSCRGAGVVRGIVQIGGGLMTSQDHECSVCHGTGSVFKDKDKCKKCKGLCVVETKKFLELYIPPGAREHEKIVLAGEADQRPEQEPGDLVFHLRQEAHAVFTRAGHDLAADIHISLAEALTGFERVVVTHLDGRGISIAVKQPNGRILRPDQILKVVGEGMPIKKSAARGDLYLVVKIDFPADGWLTDHAAMVTLRAMLPPSSDPTPTKPDVVDDVEYDADASLDAFGVSGGEGLNAAWTDDEDSEDEMPGAAQCPTQ